MPHARRVRGERTRRSRSHDAVKPVIRSSTTRARISTPSSVPALERIASGIWSLLSPSWLNAHQAASPPSRALGSRTVAERRRSGVTANHTASPTPAASSEPRE